MFSHSGDFLWKREHSGSQKHRPDHLQIRCWKVGNFPLHKFSNQRHSCRGVGSSRMNLSVNSSCFPSWLHPRYNSFGRIVSPIRILRSRALCLSSYSAIQAAEYTACDNCYRLHVRCLIRPGTDCCERCLSRCALISLPQIIPVSLVVNFRS